MIVDVAVSINAGTAARPIAGPLAVNSLPVRSVEPGGRGLPLEVTQHQMLELECLAGVIWRFSAGEFGDLF
jgi:hypothetical protein